MNRIYRIHVYGLERPLFSLQAGQSSTNLCKSPMTTESKDRPKRPKEISPKKDYYQILGVNYDATYTEIREAYYKRAKELHPDVNPSPLAESEFLRIQEAFKVLKTKQTRQIYNTSHKIEESLDDKAKDMEAYWMTRKKMGPRRVWSEKMLFKYMMADQLRPQVRRYKKRGKIPESLETLVRNQDKMEYPKWMPENRPIPSKDELMKNSMAMLSFSMAIVGALYYLQTST